MNLRQLRYFLALAQDKNFGRAAERLHISQPPLTRQIRALEQSVGAQLFHRTPKGVELTEVGKVLLEEAPNLLAVAQRTQERVQRSAQGLAGRLDIGLFTSSVLDVIPRILTSFHAQRPDVQLGLHTMNKPQQIEALLERRIDIGFNRLVPITPGIKVEVVARERMLVALPKNHALCTHETLSLAELEDQPMIVYPNLPVSGLAQKVAEAFRREERRLHVVQEVEDVLTSLSLVSAGFGVCITTAPAARLGLPNVVYRPLYSPWLPDIELNCLYREGDRSILLNEMLTLIRTIESAVVRESAHLA